MCSFHTFYIVHRSVTVHLCAVYQSSDISNVNKAKDPKHNISNALRIFRKGLPFLWKEPKSTTLLRCAQKAFHAILMY